MVWDIEKIVVDKFYVNEQYNEDSDSVFFYDDHLRVDPAVRRRPHQPHAYSLSLKWHLHADDLLSRHPILHLECTHRGFFIPDGKKDRETMTLMMQFAQLEFAAELARQLKATALAKYQFKKLDYMDISERVFSAVYTF